MRLISYRSGGEHRIGVRAAGGIVALDGPSDMTEFLARGERALDAARRAVADAEADSSGRVDPSEIELLPVVPRPPKIVCVARNYGAHAAEGGETVTEHPNLFARFPRSLIADGEPIVVPAVSSQADWEAELAVVIGRGGRHIARERAYDHVAGYALFNDVSIRDWQNRVKGGQFTAGKNFDASGPLGPDLVTKDEVPDPMNLRICLRVNRQTKQDGNTREMTFPIPVLIEFISTFTTLEPGDVIATGTPSGVGQHRTPPEYLTDGDVVEVEIETIGIQRCPVVAESA